MVMSAGSCPMQPVTGQARPYPRRIGARRTGNHLPVPLLYRTAKPRQKEQARTQIMFSLAQTTYLNTTRLGSAQFGLKERGQSPVTHSAGLAAGAAQPANTTTTPPPLARGNYPHNPSLRQCPQGGERFQAQRCTTCIHLPGYLGWYTVGLNGDRMSRTRG